MPYFRLRQGNRTIASAQGGDAETVIMGYADLNRVNGPVTIQRQEASQNVPGKWYWKRHMLLEKWPVDTAVKSPGDT